MAVDFDNDNNVKAHNVTASNNLTVGGNAAVTGNMAVTGNAIVTGTMTVGGVDVTAGVEATGTAPIKVYAAGTAYSLTATAAALTFGTTSPAVTISTAGTYLIRARVQAQYNAATFATSRTVTLKLRRTNNTAADLTNGSTTTITGIVTTLTALLGVFEVECVYTTANVDDSVALFGVVSVVPSAGSLDCTEAAIMAVRIL